jgi:hypothetical protein
MTAESTHELTDGAGAVNLTAAFPSPTIPFHLSRETTNRWRARRGQSSPLNDVMNVPLIQSVTFRIAGKSLYLFKDVKVACAHLGREVPTWTRSTSNPLAPW